MLQRSFQLNFQFLNSVNISWASIMYQTLSPEDMIMNEVKKKKSLKKCVFQFCKASILQSKKINLIVIKSEKACVLVLPHYKILFTTFRDMEGN